MNHIAGKVDYKRYYDLFIALIFTLILALPIFILFIMNRILSGKPVFFIQDRIGKRGKIFRLIKFRTMLIRERLDSPITVKGDDRVTQFGSYLRRWKLDELPQLWNVLRGDMSFVGPRPDVPGYYDKLEGEARIILELRPGITGPATLKYRNEEELLAAQMDPISYNDTILFPDKVRINLEYLKRSSFLLDIRLMVITAGLMKSSSNDFWMN